MANEVSVIPVETVAAAADNALAVHETLDAAAHQEIANTENEDYTWLTDRLDALSAELSNQRSLQLSQYQEMTTLLQANQEQSRTLIEAQSRMIDTLTSNLSQLSQTALLTASSQLIPNESESSSTTQEETPTVIEVTPANAERTPAEIQEKRRRRM